MGGGTAALEVIIPFANQPLELPNLQSTAQNFQGMDIIAFDTKPRITWESWIVYALQTWFWDSHLLNSWKVYDRKQNRKTTWKPLKVLIFFFLNYNGWTWNWQPKMAHTDGGTQMSTGRNTLSYGRHFVWFQECYKVFLSGYHSVKCWVWIIKRLQAHGR